MKPEVKPDVADVYPDTPAWTMFFDGPLYQKYSEFMKEKDFSKILLTSKLKLANLQGGDAKPGGGDARHEEWWDTEIDLDQEKAANPNMPKGWDAKSVVGDARHDDRLDAETYLDQEKATNPNIYTSVSEEYYRDVEDEKRRVKRRTRAYIVLGLVILAALAFGTALVIHYFFVPSDGDPSSNVNISLSENIAANTSGIAGASTVLPTKLGTDLDITNDLTDILGDFLPKDKGRDKHRNKTDTAHGQVTTTVPDQTTTPTSTIKVATTTESSFLDLYDFFAVDDPWMSNSSTSSPREASTTSTTEHTTTPTQGYTSTTSTDHATTVDDTTETTTADTTTSLPPTTASTFNTTDTTPFPTTSVTPVMTSTQQTTHGEGTPTATNETVTTTTTTTAPSEIETDTDAYYDYYDTYTTTTNDWSSTEAGDTTSQQNMTTEQGQQTTPISRTTVTSRDTSTILPITSPGAHSTAAAFASTASDGLTSTTIDTLASATSSDSATTEDSQQTTTTSYSSSTPLVSETSTPDTTATTTLASTEAQTSTVTVTADTTSAVVSDVTDGADNTLSSTTTDSQSTTTVDLPTASTEQLTTTVTLSILSTNSQTSISDAPTTTGEIPTTTRELPTTTGELPTTTDELPTTTGELPTTTGDLPTTAGELPTTTGELPTTAEIPTTAHTELPTTTPTVQTTLPENYNMLKMYPITAYTGESTKINCNVKYAVHWKYIAIRTKSNWNRLEVRLYSDGRVTWSRGREDRHDVMYDVKSEDGFGEDINMDLIINAVECGDSQIFLCILESKVSKNVQSSKLAVVAKPSSEVRLTLGPSIIEGKALRLTATWSAGYPKAWTNISWMAIDQHNKTFNLDEFGKYREYDLSVDHSTCQTLLTQSFVIYPTLELNTTTVTVSPDLAQTRYFVNDDMRLILRRVRPGQEEILVIPQNYCQNGDKETFIPHPFTKCNKYIRCLPDDLVIMQCAGGTCFYRGLKECV